MMARMIFISFVLLYDIISAADSSCLFCSICLMSLLFGLRSLLCSSGFSLSSLHFISPLPSLLFTPFSSHPSALSCFSRKTS